MAKFLVSALLLVLKVIVVLVLFNLVMWMVMFLVRYVRAIVFAMRFKKQNGRVPTSDEFRMFFAS